MVVVIFNLRPRNPGGALLNYPFYLRVRFIFGTVMGDFMISSSPKFQKRNIVITLVVLFVFSLGIFFYKDSQPVAFFEGVIQSMFSVPKQSLYSFGKSGEVDSSTDKKFRELEQRMVDYQLLKSDNEALKSQFDSSGETSISLVAAKIIGFQGESRHPSQFVINVGKKNKIKIGMTVIYQKNLIGKIEKVSSNYSVVETPFNSKFKVLAKYPDTGANGILVGRNDFLLFDGVVITDTLKKDGIIVTKGEVDSNGVGVVPDIIIGKITSISKNETAPFQSAEVNPLIDYTRLSNVFVISQM